jgi:hypothetical protein
LDGSAGRVVPASAGHLILFQVHEPHLSLQALLTAALFSLQSQTPVVAIRDLEGAGGRPPFAGPEGWLWKMRTQHDASVLGDSEEWHLAYCVTCKYCSLFLSRIFSGSLQIHLPLLIHRVGVRFD